MTSCSVSCSHAHISARHLTHSMALLPRMGVLPICRDSRIMTPTPASKCTAYASRHRKHGIVICQAAAAVADAVLQAQQDAAVTAKHAQRPSSPPKPLPTPPLQSTFAQVIPYLGRLALGERQMYPRLLLAFVCMVVSKASGLLCPLLLKQAVDALRVSSAVAVAAALKALLCYGLCDILKHISKEMQGPIFTPVSQAAARRVAYHTFSHVLDLDNKFHLDRRTGRLSRILERGTRSIQMLYRAIIFTFIPTMVELVAVCGLLSSRFSPLVTALVAVTFSLYVSWTLWLTQLATEVRKEVNQLDNLTTSKAVDALLNYETVALFTNQKLEVNQYDNYLRGYQQASVQTEKLAATLNAGQSVILAAGLTGVMMMAVTSVKAGGVTAGDLVLIQGLLLQLWAPLQFLGWFYRELRSSLVDMEDFFNILRTKSNLVDGTKPLPKTAPLATTTTTASFNRPMPVDTAGVAVAVTTGAPCMGFGSRPTNGSSHGHGSSNGNGHAPSHIEWEHAIATVRQGQPGQAAGPPTVSGQGLEIELVDVKFGYNPDRQILKGVSLQIPPGASVAVVGSSGSGKSTVLKLLTRLYDVNGGSVRLNGADVRELKMQSLRDAVSVVPQDTVLFNDTILQNIRYGRPDASDEEVMAAAQMARLTDAVMKMPDGFSTVVGERGLKLSGGEKQRVAIARAFLRAPRLLICDEATSALDSETEAQIMASLNELAQGRTSVFVAHRLSTIKGCDKIIVLRDGLVVEEGSHEQLMTRQGGVYREMWELQAAEEKAAVQLQPSTPSSSDDDTSMPFPAGNHGDDDDDDDARQELRSKGMKQKNAEAAASRIEVLVAAEAAPASTGGVAAEVANLVQ